MFGIRRLGSTRLVWLSKRGTACLVLHPVSYPNKGPLVEHYMAEEAIGLAKSLGWSVIEGPFWGTAVEKSPEIGKVATLEQFVIQNDGKVRDGTYMRTPQLGGATYYNGGFILDMDQSSSDGDLYTQWRNKKLRSSLALKSLVRTKRITQNLFFTKGKVERIAEHVKNRNITCIFINAELNPGQIRNLQKYFEAKLNGESVPFGYNAAENESQTEFESQKQKSKQSTNKDRKTVRIFDRFSIILQIFAKRAKTPIAKLQLQLNYLNYLKTRLLRSSGSTYSSAHNLFRGDLTKAEQINLQIVSAKQRRAHAAMSGGGQSQLELQRRQIRDKEARIRRELQEQKNLRDQANRRKKINQFGIPTIALIGYTNAGKSATMNQLLKKKEVESEDLLFQTLSTTVREISFPSGSKAKLLDTIGFISHLPHQLVESFKTTLEEVKQANILFHIVDISHPNYELQRQTVLKVLEQLGYDQKFLKERMIEIWNKIDLVPEQEILKLPNSDAFKVSATLGTGIKQLMMFSEQMAHKQLNKAKHKMKYSIDEHFTRVSWLRANANIPHELNEKYEYEKSKKFPNGYVQYQIYLDSTCYGKYLKEFEEEDKSVRRTAKGMPPAGWADKK